ncbi:5-formyltetrahydrofolate cyclo-ligase [Teredinibacter purpureus]|uniref:5-formyltetrahydrofolate cyclo-ligase n=1 Tax=Teredinibacter purpureus TaxID=2731756 RepID=UPI0009E25789|nr:5-formyltetrahydrofolate cyclo-ligase [Teredinibacter purpureus]
MNRSVQRHQLRRLRKTLTPSEQRSAAYALCRNIARLPDYQRATRIALYFANDGEISPHFIAAMALRQHKHVYYPVLTRQKMIFRPYRQGAKLTPNRFGIPEPLPLNKPIATRQLDLVLLPLVGFDNRGNRMGMGGGFYDRTFAYKRRHPFLPPVLIGLAHRCQERPQLEIEHWDIPMDFIVTDQCIIRSRTHNKGANNSSQAQRTGLKRETK